MPNKDGYWHGAAPTSLQEGTKVIAGEINARRTGVWFGEGPAGFAMLAGAPDDKLQAIEGGVLIAFSFTPMQLRYLRSVINGLLAPLDEARAKAGS
jgi:hypothetical protein